MSDPDGYSPQTVHALWVSSNGTPFFSRVYGNSVTEKDDEILLGAVHSFEMFMTGGLGVNGKLREFSIGSYKFILRDLPYENGTLSGMLAVEYSAASDPAQYSARLDSILECCVSKYGALFVGGNGQNKFAAVFPKIDEILGCRSKEQRTEILDSLSGAADVKSLITKLNALLKTDKSNL